MTNEEIIAKLQQSVLGFDNNAAKEAAQAALKAGIDPMEAINKGLYPALQKICEEFENTTFLTDILLGSDAFYAGVEVLKAAIDPAKLKANRKGVVVLGVVEGDIHDLGKNMVKYLMEAEGFEVHDIGFNTKAEKFVEKAIETNADIIMISLMLSSMFPQIKKIVDLAKAKGVKAKIMAGGGPVTEGVAKKYGAEGWALTAPQAVKQAIKMLKKA